MGSTVPELVQTSSEIPMPMAVELPGDIPMYPPPRHASGTPSSRQSYDSGSDALAVPGAGTPSPRSSGDRLPVPPPKGSNQHSPRLVPVVPAGTSPMLPPQGRTAKPPITTAGGRNEKESDSDRLVVNAPTPAQYRYATGADKIAIMGPDEQPRWIQGTMASRPVQMQAQKVLSDEPPPLPPKTPLPESQSRFGGRGHAAAVPYPLDDDAPPPAVNMAKKPNYSSR